MAVLLTLLLLAAVIAVVATPLLGHPRAVLPTEPSAARANLEAARAAKYREIRDAELDYRTGKLSPEDYEAVDAALRAEAIELLDALQALESGGPPEGSPRLS